MKQRAPRVFRWTEHMNAPEIQSPEFADAPMVYLADDAVPDTTLALLRLCVGDTAESLVRSADVYNTWVAGRADRPAGSLVSPEGFDEPVVGKLDHRLRGVDLPMGAGVYTLWVLQRALDWYASLGRGDRADARSLLADCGGEALVDIQLARRLTRVGSGMALD